MIRLLKTMSEPFEFSDPPKGHFMSLPKQLTNSLQILGDGRGCFTLYLLIVCFCLQGFYWLNYFIRWYKCASAGLTVLSVFMIANHAIRYIMERRRRNELEKRYTSPDTKLNTVECLSIWKTNLQCYLWTMPMHMIPLHFTLPHTFNNLNNFMQGSRCSC